MENGRIACKRGDFKKRMVIVVRVHGQKHTATTTYQMKMNFIC